MFNYPSYPKGQKKGIPRDPNRRQTPSDPQHKQFVLALGHSWVYHASLDYLCLQVELAAR